MTHLTNVVIDHDVIGWAHSNMQKLKDRYNNIYIVGKDNSPEELMNNNISDLNIAKYCLNNNCDLVTADKKSYVDWFNSYNGITTGEKIWTLIIQSKSTMPINPRAVHRYFGAHWGILS